MATGASVADLALILVSADEGLTRQTKRHAVVLSMLGVRNIVLAVNKMDRVGWSEVIFRGMEAQFRDFAATLGSTQWFPFRWRPRAATMSQAAPIACPGMTGRHCLNIWKM